MVKHIISTCVVLTLILSGCKKENSPSDSLRIEYGTSFGECLGYCKRDLSITSGKIVFTKSGWIDSVIPKECTEKISATDYARLTRKIDLEAFMNLSEVIGCPDCADGGSEWIRIVTLESDRKVTFEYGNEPEGVKAFIGILRNYLAGFATCN